MTGPKLTRAGGFGGGQRFRKRAAKMPGAELEHLILGLLGQDTVPLSAYQLLAALRDRGRPVPVMSIYRALDRLIARDQVQRVGTLAAFRIKDQDRAMLVICVQCGQTTAVPVPDLYAALRRIVADRMFTPTDLVIEASGRCASCHANPGA